MQVDLWREDKQFHYKNYVQIIQLWILLYDHRGNQFH